MKGPTRPTADKSQRLCSRKRLMLFPLKFQRNNRQDALAVDSAKRKNEKAVFSPRCGDETTGYHDRAKPKSSRTPTASPPNRAYRRTKDPLRPQPHRSPYRRQKADKGAHQAGGPESRTARYQIGDIRSYLFNNITFYGAFLQSPTAAFPPAVHSLPEGRAAFPHAKRGGNGQPAHILPSEQKTLFLHMDKEKQKSFGKASLFRPCRLTSFGEPHIFAL